MFYMIILSFLSVLHDEVTFYHYTTVWVCYVNWLIGYDSDNTVTQVIKATSKTKKLVNAIVKFLLVKGR